MSFLKPRRVQCDKTLPVILQHLIIYCHCRGSNDMKKSYNQIPENIKCDIRKCGDKPFVIYSLPLQHKEVACRISVGTSFKRSQAIPRS
jgi:hypothetical protein